MIPREFFVTSGKAFSPVSKLNAFDLALKDAGIAQCNLVKVSSILPPNCKEVKPRALPVGSIIHAVVSRMDGEESTTISAGLAWSYEKNGSYGLVAEAYGYMDEKTIRDTLHKRIENMAKARNITIGDIKYKIETLRVPLGNYGCTIAVLVYLP
ncbi:pyruvoyl-dependent arginine decarboxylase [Candidatus Bathyarchaeota archaeon]|nr:MAG: pyruvoyl-dependent arginine decarboxylase [Candidatus Bathyarchaeota archaeon]